VNWVKQQIKSIAFLMMMVFMAASCNPREPTEGALPMSTPTPAALNTGMGGIKGRIDNLDQYWSSKAIFIFAAQFYGDSGGDGAFILEPTLFPKAMVDANGYFQISDIPPRKYILIVGPKPESGLMVKHTGTAVIYDVAEGELLDIGTIHLEE
jgi:hypothetical protein